MTRQHQLLLTLPWLALAARAQTRRPRVGVIAPWQAPDAMVPITAFAAVLRQGAQAGLLLPSPLISASADRVAALPSRRRCPVITTFPNLARFGALKACGPDIRDMCRRAALRLGRVLKGGPVATMPIERPDRSRFVINERKAAAPGLALPPTMRWLADEVVP